MPGICSNTITGLSRVQRGLQTACRQWVFVFYNSHRLFHFSSCFDRSSIQLVRRCARFARAASSSFPVQASGHRTRWSHKALLKNIPNTGCAARLPCWASCPKQREVSTLWSFRHWSTIPTSSVRRVRSASSRCGTLCPTHCQYSDSEQFPSCSSSP